MPWADTLGVVADGARNGPHWRRSRGNHHWSRGMRVHRHLALLAVGVFFSKEALAQIGSPTTSAGLASHSWSLSIIADGYVVPHAVFFVSPIIATDLDWLHLEARYNYEDQSTGSLWLGYSFAVAASWPGKSRL